VDALLNPAGRMTTGQSRGRHTTDARGAVILTEFRQSDKPSVPGAATSDAR